MPGSSLGIPPNVTLTKEIRGYSQGRAMGAYRWNLLVLPCPCCRTQKQPDSQNIEMGY